MGAGSSGVKARWISNSKTFWLLGIVRVDAERRRSRRSSGGAIRATVWATSPAARSTVSDPLPSATVACRDGRQVAGREGVDRHVAVGQSEQPRRAVGAGDTGVAHAVGVEGEDVGAVEQRRRRPRTVTSRPGSDAGSTTVMVAVSRVAVAAERRASSSALYVPGAVGVHSTTRPSVLATGSPVGVAGPPSVACSMPTVGREAEPSSWTVCAERDDLVVTGVGDERLGAADPHDGGDDVAELGRRRRRAGRRTCPAWSRCAPAPVANGSATVSGGGAVAPVEVTADNGSSSGSVAGDRPPSRRAARRRRAAPAPRAALGRPVRRAHRHGDGGRVLAVDVVGDRVRERLGAAEAGRRRVGARRGGARRRATGRRRGRARR